MKKTVLALATLFLSAATQSAWAQGCILIREAAPIIGAASSTYLQPGEWQFDLGFRDSTADEHYSGTVYQAQRTELGTNVINKQGQLLFGINHQVTPRFGFAVLVPIIQASWSLPSPTAPTPGPRAVQHGEGIGDISAIGRFWLLDPLVNHSRNISIGLGFKAPTGNDDDKDTFVGITGLNPTEKAVDQSVQPGDGGWGVQLEVQGFSRMGPTFLFGSANYLINPRNTNDTASVLVGLGVPSATVPLRNVNSVPDQFVLRAGIGVPIYKGLGASVAYRMEGVPRYDLIGRSDGFRRPGDEMFIEPGVSYAFGRQVVQVNIPLAVYRNRSPDPYTGAAGDATFPGVVATASYSLRFGSAKHLPMPGEHTPLEPSGVKRDDSHDSKERTQ